MNIAIIIAAIASAIGLTFAWLGLVRLRQARVFSMLRNEMSAVFCLLVAASSLLLGSNFAIYHRLVFEQPVATISFRELEPMLFSAELSQPNALANEYQLRGDEWQLDARILKWYGFANVLGMDTQYRLHRLSVRYADIDQEREASRSVFEVSERPEVDIWKLSADHGQWLDWLVDAAYGSAIYLPMTDGAEYEVTMSQSGLVARPSNDVAKRAVSRWIGL